MVYANRNTEIDRCSFAKAVAAQLIALTHYTVKLGKGQWKLEIALLVHHAHLHARVRMHQACMKH